MRLLQFVTGTCRLPLGGFAELMGECRPAVAVVTGQGVRRVAEAGPLDPGLVQLRRLLPCPLHSLHHPHDHVTCSLR